MAKIISFANQKGGVGKSTLCIQMAFYLDSKGKKVLVIDMDPQGNTSSRVAPKQVMENGDEQRIYVGTRSADLFNAEAVQIEVTQCSEHMDLIYTPRNDPRLAEIEQESLSIADRPAENLKALVRQYEYVLIDCPPSLGRKLVGALVASTHVVIPVKLSGFSVDGVEDIVTTIVGVQRTLNRKLKIGGIVINDMDRSVSHERALKALTKAVPTLLLENKIMHRPPLDSATSDGVPVWTLRYGHVAAKEVQQVLEEILERVA